MANLEDDSTKVTSLYPDPPYFWKSHTPDAIARYNAQRQAHADQNGIDVSEVIRVPDIPDDLSYLQPPLEPADGKWRLFGEQLSLDDELQSLEAAGIQRLSTSGGTMDKDGRHVDRAFELKRLAKSLLLNFLELIGIMSHNPSHGEEKVQDIKTILVNFHHILNEYRPHQAREQLIQLMQDNLDSKRAETAAIRSVVDKAQRALVGLASMEIPKAEIKEEETPAATKANTFEGRAKANWDMLDSQFS